MLPGSGLLQLSAGQVRGDFAKGNKEVFAENFNEIDIFQSLNQWGSAGIKNIYIFY